MPADALVSAADLAAEFTHWFAANRAQATRLNHAALRPAPAQEYLAAQKALQSWLYDEGWFARGWPKEFGGTGNDVGLRAAIYDLLGAADITVPSTVNVVEILAPTLQRFAPALAERMLSPLVTGTEAWCQGFSEPEAGSDLASLRMRATPTGDGWSLSGQKIWSTRASGSDRCAVLVRTGSPESRHCGLTMFLVDMDAPGVQCRPIDDMSFTQHFGEIFFDDTYVPDERRIGDVDGGWAVAQYLLQWERGMFAWLRQAALLGLLRRMPTGDDPDLVARYGAAYQDVIALRLRSLGTLRALATGRSDGPRVSIDKLLLSRAERSVHELAHRIAPVGVDDGTADWESRVHEYLHSRSAPIYGGSAEIQRTIIATQILELGKEGPMIRLEHRMPDDGYAEIRATVDRLFQERPQGVGVADLEDFGWIEMLDAPETRGAAARAMFEGQGGALALAGTPEAFLAAALGGYEVGSTVAMLPGADSGYLGLPGGGAEPTRLLLVGADSVRSLPADRATRIRTVDPAVRLLSVSEEATAGAEPVAGAVAGLVTARLQVAHSLQLAGICAHVLALGRDHVRARHQFGRPIGSFQAVQQLLADVAVAVAAADGANRNALALLDDPESAPLAARVAVGLGTRAFDTTTRGTQQVLGAIGYTREHELHRYLYRGLVLQHLLGSRDIDRRVATAARAHAVTPPVGTWYDHFEEGLHL